MADHRHKRDTEARRKPKAQAIIGPLAVLATASAVTIGVVAADPAASDLAPLATPSVLAASDERSDEPITRSENRVKATASRDLPPPAFMSKAAITTAIKAATKQQWTTDDLNIWNQPGDKAKQLGEVEAGKKVLVTGREMWGRTEIVLEGRVPLGHRRLPLRRQADRRRRRPLDGALPRRRRRERPDRQRRLRLPLGLPRVPRRSRRTAAGATTASTPAAGRSTS